MRGTDAGDSESGGSTAGIAARQKDKKTRLYTIMYLLFGNRSDTIGVTITK